MNTMTPSPYYVIWTGKAICKECLFGILRKSPRLLHLHLLPSCVANPSLLVYWVVVLLVFLVGAFFTFYTS